MNIQEMKQCLGYLAEAKITPFIVGHTGVGKSQGVAQFAKENGYNLLELRVGQMADAGDLIGLADFVVVNGEKVATKFIKPSFFPTSGKWLIFLDEVNHALPDVRQAIFQLVLDKKLHEYIVPEDCFIVAAGNPDTSDYEVSGFNNASWVDRFCFLRADFNNETWFDYAKSTDTLSNTFVLDFVMDRPEIINYEGYEDYNFDFVRATPRSAENFAKIEKLNPPDNLLRMIGSGMVGLEFSTAYIEFKRKNAITVKAEDVLNGYSKVKEKVKKLYDRGDVIYLVSKDLVKLLKEHKKITKQMAENVRDFMLDIPKDSGKAIIDNIIMIDSLHSKQIRDVLVDNENVLEHFKEVI